MLNTYSQKIAYNTAVQVTGKAATSLLSLALLFLLTRYLGVFGFGEYTTAFVYLSFFGVIADFGFFQILVREISTNPDEEEKIASNLLTFRIFVALLVYGIGIGIAYFLPYSASIKTGILLLSLATFFLTLNSTLVGIFQAHHKMDRSALTDVIGRGIILLISLWLVRHGGSLAMIFFINVIGNFINLIASYLFVRPIVRLKPAFDFALWKRIFLEAWPLGVAAVIGIIYFKIDSFMLSLYKGSDDVGIYGAPYKILEVLIILPGLFMGNVFPVIARYVQQKDDRLKRAIQKSLDFLAIAGTGILFGGLALAPNIISFIAGKDFIHASTTSYLGRPITAPILFQILLFAVACSYISSIFSPLVLAMNKQKALIKPAFFATIINLALNFVLIPRYGYLAAAVVTVITEAFILFYLGSITVGFLGYLPRINNLLKTLLAGLFMAVLLYILRDLHIVILVFLGIISYVSCLFLLKVVTRESLKTLIMRDK